MNEEIKEILDFLKDEEEYYDGKEKVVLSSDEKVIERDDINQLLNYITSLQQKVEQLENIRKEAIEYINHATIGAYCSPIEDSWLYNLYETKHILNKGENNE